MKLPLKILIHTIYWLVFLMFSFVFSLGAQRNEMAAYVNLLPAFILNTVWAVAMFYLFYFYFIRFFEKGEFVKYLIFSIASSIAVTCSLFRIHAFFISGVEILKIKYFGPPIIGSFIIAQCGCLVRGFENWFGNIQYKSELENRNLKNELELLKSQVNPHFLFNTLNNIDSLIHKSQADASSALINLSDMLRYMIYETTVESVPLTKEIEYLKNYVKLQQLRFRETGYVKASLTEMCTGVMIAPMLFIPFVENAFKYSANKGKLPVIYLSITCREKLLEFECSNYFSDENNTHKRTGGVGLENVKRRLQLLYPGHHTLEMFNENSIFKVVLRINL